MFLYASIITTHINVPLIWYIEISKMVVVVVDGKEYNLNEQQVATMKYVEEAEAIEKGQSVIL